MQTVKRDLFAEVTGKIIASLEKGVVPWRKSWGFVEPAQNHFSGHKYQGINSLLMLLDDYRTPYFGTMRQINEAGGTVKKGTKATTVYFHDCIFKDKNGARLKEEEARARLKAGDKSVKVYPYLRMFSVFNMQDVEGIPIKEVSQIGNADNQPLAVCQDFLTALKIQPRIEVKASDRAYFNPSADRIVMPGLEQFVSSENFYGVLFHELTHWTGHPSRLNRKTLTDAVKFGDTNYSLEELTAELGTCFLCNRWGISTPAMEQDSAAYIGHWLGKLKKDNKFIWDASASAKDAFNYLIELAA
jgi:antirestriction protein ArdC